MNGNGKHCKICTAKSASESHPDSSHHLPEASIPIDIKKPEALQNVDPLRIPPPRDNTTEGYISCQLALKKSEKIKSIIKLQCKQPCVSVSIHTMSNSILKPQFFYRLPVVQTY